MTPNHELMEDVEIKKKEGLKNKQERLYQSFSESLSQSLNSFYKSLNDDSMQHSSIKLQQ